MCSSDLLSYAMSTERCAGQGGAVPKRARKWQNSVSVLPTSRRCWMRSLLRIESSPEHDSTTSTLGRPLVRLDFRFCNENGQPHTQGVSDVPEILDSDSVRTGLDVGQRASADSRSLRQLIERLSALRAPPLHDLTKDRKVRPGHAAIRRHIDKGSKYASLTSAKDCTVGAR